MLGEAARDVAAGKVKVAAQEVDARALLDEAVLFGGDLRPVQIGESPVKVLDHPFDGRETEPCVRALAVIGGFLQSALVRLSRLGHGTQVVGDIALKAGEGEAIGPLDRERQATVGQSARALVVVVGGLRAGGCEVGRRRARMVGAVEVLSVKHQIAVLEPRRRALVQLAPTRP